MVYDKGEFDRLSPSEWNRSADMTNMEHFTKEQLEHILECLQKGLPLPGVYRAQIRFDDDLSDFQDLVKKRTVMNLLGMIGSHAMMQALFGQIQRAAAGDIPILLEGETGTGKQLAARTIHRLSPRRKDPLVWVDCASVPGLSPNALSFGKDQSTYADRPGNEGVAKECRGTIVLDHVEALRPDLQSGLFQCLARMDRQNLEDTAHCAGFGIVSTTETDLKKRAAEGLFRKDLYDRLSLITIVLPPLRERGHDISHLADHFLKKHAAKGTKKIVGFSAKCLESMMCYYWPENVAELDMRIRRAVLMASGRKITPQDLGIEELLKQGHYKVSSLKEAREKFETDLISEALSRNRFSLTKAARALGISRPTLYGYIEKLGIDISRPMPENQERYPKLARKRFLKRPGRRSG